MIYGDEDYKAIQEVPKGASTKDGLIALGTKIADEIIAGVKQREVRRDRNNRLKQLYTHDAPIPDNLPFKGASTAHLNVMQVKIDALNTNVMRTITSRAPYCVAQTYTNKKQNIVIEKSVQEFADRAMVSDALSAISQDAGLFNIGVLYARWCPKGNDFDPIPGVEICPIEVQDHFCYPAGVADMPHKAWSIGHRVWLRRSVVDARKKTGEYANVKATSPDDPQVERLAAEPDVTGYTAHETASQDSNQLIPLWYVCFKADDKLTGEPVWWWGLISEKDKQFLQLKRHTETVPPYHVIRYKPTKGEYWPIMSVGNDLQGVQLEIDNLIRMWFDAVVWNSYGVMTGSSMGRAEAHVKYGPGDFINTDAESQTQYHNPKADVSYIPPAIEMLLGYADQIVRISQESTGGESPGTTATQAAIRQAGQKAGVDDYIAMAGRGVVSLYEHIHELIVNNVNDWFPILSEYMGLTEEDKQVLMLPTRWMLNTNSIGATPGNQVQVLQMILEAGTTNPQSALDLRGLGYQILVQAERMGIAGATDLQLPEDPQQMIQVLAGQMGIDPLILSDAIQQAQQTMQMAQEGQKNDQRRKIGEAVASGMGLDGVQPGASAGQNAFHSVTG